MMEQRYRERFITLIQEFVREVEGLAHPPGITVPEPFLPLVGKSYETAPLRLVVMGQDTRGWGHLPKFIASEKERRNWEAFMSVPALTELLNRKGFTRNDGSTYQGGRGSYRLIRTAYDRLVHAGLQEQANEVAHSFRRPDFAYAYATD